MIIVRPLIKFILIAICCNATFNTKSMYVFNKELIRQVMKEEQRSKRIWFGIGAFTLFLASGGWMALWAIFDNLKNKRNLENIVKNAKGSDLNQLFDNTTYDYTNPINQISQEEQEKIKNVIEKYQDALAVLFMGPTGSGKTTIMVNIAKNAQKQGSTIYNFVKFQREDYYHAIHEIDALEAIIKDAEKRAETTQGESYILLNELHDFIFIKKRYGDEGYSRLLDLLEDSEVRKRVHFLATTNDPKAFHKEIYRPGRFDLEVLLKGNNSKEDQSFENIKNKYETDYPKRAIRRAIRTDIN